MCICTLLRRKIELREKNFKSPHSVYLERQMSPPLMPPDFSSCVKKTALKDSATLVRKPPQPAGP